MLNRKISVFRFFLSALKLALQPDLQRLQVFGQLKHHKSQAKVGGHLPDHSGGNEEREFLLHILEKDDHRIVLSERRFIYFPPPG